MLAINLSLQGKKVDIVTSNEVLAIRDAKDKQAFYKLFNKSSGTNCIQNDENATAEEMTKKKQEVYKCDIVYGNVHHFSADIIIDEYY